MRHRVRSPHPDPMVRGSSWLSIIVVATALVAQCSGFSAIARAHITHPTPLVTASSGVTHSLPHHRRAAVVTAKVKPPPPSAISSAYSAVVAFGSTRVGAATGVGVLTCAVGRLIYLNRYGKGARFIAAEKFNGKKAGYTHRSGSRGTGYYKVSKAAAKAAPAKQAPKAKAKKAAQQEEADAKALIDFGGAVFAAAFDLGGQAVSAAADAVTRDDDATAIAPAAATTSSDGDDDSEGDEADEATDEAEDGAAFIAAATFAGRKEGYVFKSGPEGKGYYNREYTWE